MMKNITKYMVVWLGLWLVVPIMFASGNEVLCTPPTVNVSFTEKVMTGSSITLKATGDFSYCMWTPTATVSDPDKAETKASPKVSTTYTITGYKEAASNMLKNGSFESGDQDFTTDYVHSGRQYGVYTIGTKPADLWGSYSYGECWAHSGKGTYFMIVDGSDKPNQVVWRQTVTVNKNTDYALSCWLVSLLATVKRQAYAKLQFFINDQQVGDIFESPDVLHQWIQFYHVWNSGNATSAKIEIRNQNEDGLGNDFGLDDINFAPLDEDCSTEKQVTVLVMQRTSETKAICPDSLPYVWHGKEYKAAGTYKDTVLSAAGYKDSIVILTLSLDESLCPPEPACYDSLVYRKWKDVLFCANGDHQIVAYQWYQDTVELIGETQQYLYRPEGFGTSAYHIKAQCVDGTIIETCPKVFDDTPASAKTYVNMNTVVRRGGALHIEMSDTEAEVSIYTTLGQFVEKTMVHSQISDIPISVPGGVYIVQVKGANIKENVIILVD